MSRYVFALVLPLLFGLAGCGPTLVRADVTRFTTLPPGGSGESFAMAPDAEQKGSLEFQHYAGLVAGQLIQRGWRPAPGGANADMVVILHWGGGSPGTVVSEVPADWGAWGGPGPWYGGGIPGPYPDWDVATETVWPKWLTVEIDDGTAWRAKDRRPVFESRATTSTHSQAIAPVMPYLIQAVFTNFPGGNGQTVRVNVPVTEK